MIKIKRINRYLESNRYEYLYQRPTGINARCLED